ncbi:hypothetical protein MKX42_06340 [Paenibacillus sp. FSL R7-0204]|uniref:hypothetical protein n=1 Tax=Paenibacillus sp. FSL R7-0204 TaxID=2921675 RepID=UPI0030F791DA
MIISTVLQLSGGLLLASVFTMFAYPILPVHNQKPHGLRLFLFSQLQALWGALLLILGYFLPYFEVEIKAPLDFWDKWIWLFGGLGAIGCVTFLLSHYISCWLYKKAPVYQGGQEPPTYNVFHILFSRH